MAARAAAAKARTEPDQRAAGEQLPGQRVDARGQRLARGPAKGRAGCDQAHDESDAPQPLAGTVAIAAVEDAADAGDAAVEAHQQDGGQADQGAAHQGGHGREVGHAGLQVDGGNDPREIVRQPREFCITHLPQTASIDRLRAAR